MAANIAKKVVHIVRDTAASVWFSAIIMRVMATPMMTAATRLRIARPRAVAGAVVALAALFLAGCGGKKAEVIRYPAPKVDPWVLEWRDPTVTTPAWLSNGLIGVRVGRDGTGSGQPAFDISAYQKAGTEEKLEPQPNLLNCTIEVAGQRIDPIGCKDYRQVLDMRTGQLTTTWTQRIGDQALSVEVTVRIDRNRRLLYQSFKLFGTPGADVRVMAFAPGKQFESSVMGTWAGQEVLSIMLLHGVLSTRMSHEADVHTVTATMDSGAMEVHRTIKVDVVERKVPPVESIADIEIEGPVEDQQAVRSFLLSLISAVHPAGGKSVSPFSLSSERYFGHVFWDADVWVLPALTLLSPARAAAIAEYRLHMAQQARLNFDEWIRAGRPTGKGNMPPMLDMGRPPAGLKYPWESSVSGRETVPGPSKFQDHITGSVAWGLGQAAALDLIRQTDFEQVLAGAASFYAWRSEGDPPQIKGTMSPDENFTGNNDLYTNLIAQWCRNNGHWGAGPGPKYYLPRDDKGFLSYDGDALRGYKQAAAILAIYPLQYPEAERQAMAMLVRFQDKVTPNGPAMSDSVAALITARFGDTDAAYRLWQKSWKDFTQHPFLMFSEKRKSERTVFVTGAAGCLQTVLYGFLGFRIDYGKQPGAAWSTPLLGGNWLSCKPKLPKAWTKVTLKNFVVLGKRYTLTVDHNRVTVTQGDF